MIDDLRVLRCFVAVAEELNFRKAAERLNMSQPPLSRLVSGLEEEMGVALFLRNTRMVALTREGKIFLKEALQVLDQAAAAGRRLRHQFQSGTRPLMLGSASAAFFVGVPALVGDFRSRHPQFPVEITGMNSREQIDALVSGRIDAGFVLPPVAAASLSSRIYASVRMSLAVPKGHPLAKLKRTTAPLEDFAGETFILHDRDRDPGMYEGIVSCCTRAGFRPRTRVLKPDEHCMGLVTSGAGVHFSVADSACISHSGVSFIKLSGEAPVLEVALAWRIGDPSPALKAFLEMGEKAKRGRR